MKGFNVYFPYLYEHEMLYSILLRNRIHMGIAAYSYRRTNNTQGYIEFMNVSKHVDLLEGYMNYAYSKEELLELTGLYKLFYIFLPYEYQKLAIKSIKKKQINEMIKAFGFNHQQYNKEVNINYCPICLVEDINRYGEPYIHSEHQLKGVKACGKHGCELHAKSIPYYEVCRMVLPEVNDNTIEKLFNLNVNQAPNLDAQIGKFILDVLNDKDYKTINLQFLNETIMRLLVKKGYSIKEKNFRTNIADELEQKYGNGIFEYFCGNKEHFIKKKLEYFYNPNLYQIRLSPIEYIVLIIWLAGDYDCFKEQIIYHNILASVDCDINDIKWLEKYNLCLDYYKRYKKQISIKDIYKGVKIGVWYYKEKNNYNKGNLSDYKISLLEEIGMFKTNETKLELLEIENNELSKNTLSWHSYYDCTKEFINAFKHQPVKDTIYLEVKIGRWFTDQKKRYNKGLLPLEKEQLFTELLNAPMYIEKIWDDKYNLVKEYMEKYSIPPVRDTVFNVIPIGQWLHNQIESYKKREMSDSKIECFKNLLIRIGELDKNREREYKVPKINWGARDDESWEENYKLFLEFINLFERAPHQREQFKEKSIGMWYSDQVKYFKQGILIHYRKEKMNQFIKITIDYGDNWYCKYKLVEDYFNNYGKLPNCYYVVDDIKVGRWLIDQRQVYKLGKMKLTRQDLFEKLESTRNKYNIRKSYEKSRNERWDNYYNLTIEYIQEYSYKPPQYEEVIHNGFNLREWVHKQDQRYKKGLLEKERANRYKQIYEAPTIFDVRWEKNRCAVIDYINKNNQAPSNNDFYDGVNLGNWLIKQKDYYTKGKMPLHRVPLYEEVMKNY